MQTRLRHTQLSMTGRYIKQILEEVRLAVQGMDEKLRRGTAEKGCAMIEVRHTSSDLCTFSVPVLWG